MDDLREIWQSQHVEPITMSIEELRAKATKFERRIRSRNLRETIVAVILIPIFAAAFVHFQTPVERVGMALNIAALFYVIYRLNGAAAATAVPADIGFESCVSFHRRELERHRDLLRTVSRWYMGPLVPGVVVFTLGTIGTKVRAGHPLDWWRALPALVLLAVWYLVVVRLNDRAADCLQRRIDELDRFAAR